jgi:hypothetical protein
MKIVSTGRTISTTEYYEKKLKERRRRRLLVVGCLLLVAGLAVFLSRLEQVRIREVTVSGARVIPEDKVIAAASEAISGYYLYLIPRNNALLYPRQGVEETLSQTFPRTSSVSASLAGMNALNIEVSEREPYALYCPPGEATCYFLDYQGFIFDISPTFSEGVYFTYSFESPLPDPLGREMLPVEEFQALAQFIEGLPRLGLDAYRAVISADSFEVILPREARVLAPRGVNLALIYSNVGSFLESDEIKGDKDFLSRFSELDLRTENKVFYRFREVE